LNNAAQRFPNSLYDSSFNRKATANRRYSYMPLRHTKDDRQWGIKLDLTGTYGLFGREHDFFVGYAYGDEKIRSEYLEIYERRHRVRPNTGATHGVYAGSCQGSRTVICLLLWSGGIKNPIGRRTMKKATVPFMPKNAGMPRNKNRAQARCRRQAGVLL
ncbi:hypothetical protein GC070_11855, partial [Neisseria meningitidis]|nr:hypothetical protein [Neisseria meningitidis]